MQKVLHIMNVHSKNPHIQSFGLALLTRFNTPNNAETLNLILTNDYLDHIIRMMKLYPQSEHIQKSACELFLNLSENNDAFRVKFKAADGMFRKWFGDVS
jgi:hypothetical protein